MKSLTPLAALAGLLLSFTTQAADETLTVLATGDNRGEVAECGCSNLPTGGLDRRKAAVEQDRARGPVLLLDAGNALFKDAASDGTAKQKAGFILEMMGAMGTDAMAVGRQDLVAGPRFLESAARKAKVKLLSANLTLNGKPLFDASTVLTRGGRRIGVVGVGPAFDSHAAQAGLVGAPPVPAAVAEARKLKGQVDVVIVLAALPIAEAHQLAREAGGSVDLILQSSDSRRPTLPVREDAAFIVSTGQRGQVLARVALELTGQGPLVDTADVSRAEQSLALLEARMAQSGQKELEARRAELQARLESLRQRTGRGLSLSTVVLGPGVAGDPALKARVAKLLPPGSPSSGDGR